MAEFATIEDQLARELRQYRFVENLFQYFRTSVTQQGANAKRNTAVYNVFGRWLQVVQHFNPMEHESPYRLLPHEPVDENIMLELKRMLREDLRVNEDTAETITNGALERISEFANGDHADEALPNVAVTYTDNGIRGKLSVGGFITQNCPRVRYLAQKFGAEQTVLMCLRYSQLSKFRGGESGMCVSGLNALREVGMVTFEGFSSPLNCRLLGREGVKFCSLFEDTDAAFGSLGNFFRIDLSDHPGGWSLGPPFVEPVLNATADRVLKALEETEPGQLWFFVTFPNWDDNPGWQMLNQSPKKVARIDFDKREFWQQDDYGSVYQPDVRICIFVLGQLPEDVDLVKLRNRISEVDKAMVNDDWLQACPVEQQQKL